MSKGIVANIRCIGRNLTPQSPPGRFEILVAREGEPPPTWSNPTVLCLEDSVQGFDGALQYAYDQGYEITPRLLTHFCGAKREHPLILMPRKDVSHG